MSPRLTIGLPFHNSAATLPDAIRSIFAQTFEDWELLLIDDGSTDRSWDIATAVRDSRVRVEADGVHRGLVERLNQASRLARTEYLARMDADDLMHPERLEMQLRYLDAHPGIEVLGTAAFAIDGRHEVTGLRGSAPLDVRPGAVLAAGLFIHPTVCGRTSWFVDHPYDPRYFRAEDHELWCRTCRDTHFAKLDTPLYFYREERVNLASYLSSCRSDRKVFRDCGPVLGGNLRTVRLLCASHLKSLAYRLLTPFGADRFLIRRRATPLDERLARQAQQVIERVRNTDVPGLSSPEARLGDVARG